MRPADNYRLSVLQYVIQMLYSVDLTHFTSRRLRKLFIDVIIFIRHFNSGIGSQPAQALDTVTTQRVDFNYQKVRVILWCHIYDVETFVICIVIM